MIEVIDAKEKGCSTMHGSGKVPLANPARYTHTSYPSEMDADFFFLDEITQKGKMPTNQVKKKWK